MTPQEIINLIQAYKEGKQIEFQFKTKNSFFPEHWKITKSPTWNFETYNYRVKSETPKTMHQYLLCNTRNDKYICTTTFYSSMEDAIKDYKNNYWTVVKRLDYTQITITE